MEKALQEFETADLEQMRMRVVNQIAITFDAESFHQLVQRKKKIEDIIRKKRKNKYSSFSDCGH